MPMKTCNFSGN